MPQTVWRPYPFDKPPTKLENAAQQRQRVVDIIRSAGRPMTMIEIAKALDLEGKPAYNKARRYVTQVAFQTRSKTIVRGQRVIGWTLKEEYRKEKP
jgi:hypothetical protein